MSSMQLRKRVVPPKRYEPDVSDGERYMPSVRKPLFLAKVVPFNPHLPPAAFPSLDEPPNPLSEAHLGRDLGKHHHPPNVSLMQPQLSGMSNDAARMSSPISSILTSGADLSFQNTSYQSEKAGSEHRLGASKSDSIMHEMETSEEDDDGGPWRPSIKPTQLPMSWKKVAPIHQLEITCALMEEGASKDEVMQLLKLSPEQWQEMSLWDERRLVVERREEKRIAEMQTDLHWFLLDGDGTGSTTLDSSRYGDMLTFHLGRFIDGDKSDFYTTTKSHFRKAQVFLQSWGLPLSLLGEWIEPYIGAPPFRERNGSNGRASEGLGIDPDGAEETLIRQTPHTSVAEGSSKDSPPNKHDRPPNPVRRRFIGMSNETPSGPPRSGSTGFSRNESAPTQPSLVVEVTAPQMGRSSSILNVAPDPEPHKFKTLTPSRGPPLLDNSHHPTHPHSYVDEEQKLENLATITVEPKKTWSGTAIPASRNPPNLSQISATPAALTAHTEPQSILSRALPTDNAITQCSSEALERQRAESMKYSYRIVAKSPERFVPQMLGDVYRSPNTNSTKNYKHLAVMVSNTPSAKSNQNSRRTSITGSTASSRDSSAMSTTPVQKPADTPATSLQTLSGSGSSTRSQNATRLPARFRDEMMLAASPTHPKKGRKPLVKGASEIPLVASDTADVAKPAIMSVKSPMADMSTSQGVQPKKQVIPHQQSLSTPSMSRKGSRRQPSAESAISTNVTVTHMNEAQSSTGGKAARKTTTRTLLSEQKPPQEKRGGAVSKRSKGVVRKTEVKRGKTMAL